MLGDVNLDWLVALLACPRCEGAVAQANGAWTCERCGAVGRQVLDVPDFVPAAATLPMAAGGQMDLAADERLAKEFVATSKGKGLAAAVDLAEARRVADQDEATPSALARRARRRFNRKFARTNAEAGAIGGGAVLAKIDAKLDELGWPAMGSQLALEAGGGEGLYLKALSDRFERVVFVDASLANIALAAATAAEDKLDNIGFVRADVTALPFRRGSFDLVHQNGVVEHVHDPERMVSEGARVRSADGYYVCVSPNRLAITPEPHFRLPAFGFIPGPVRAALAPVVRGLPLDGGGTEPRTLGQLRRYLDAAGGHDRAIFFLPRQLAFTARQTPVRRVVRAALSRPLLGDAVDLTLNRLLLPVVPYHIAIVPGRGAATPTVSLQSS